MENLRHEIMQAENTRSDLLKWKLGLVGAIGAAGLGFAGSAELGHADLVLCVLPPVAVYVDLLALHLSLRILVIGAYFRKSDAAEARVYREYEERAWKARNPSAGRSRFRLVRAWRARHPGAGGSAFRLEDWALSYSTYALCVAVAAYGGYQFFRDEWEHGVPFVLSGAVGAVAAFLCGWKYERRRRVVDEVA